MEFRPVSLDTGPLFRRYSSQTVRNCDASFANIFCWQATYHTLYAEAEGFLVVKYRIEGDDAEAYMLFGHDFSAEAISRVLPLLEEDARNGHRRLTITGLPRCAAMVMRQEFGSRFACAAARDNADYIYDADSLRTLSGRKYQSKRNHINRFNDLYDYTYEMLTAGHKEECMRLEAVWQRHHANDETISAERLAIIRAFENFDALGLSGGAIRIDGRVAAFTYGSAINDTTFDIHVEKADTSFDGIFPAINRMFAETIPERYRFINREEDMGIEGLRRSKLSYHPAHLEYKYTACALTAEELTVRRLWDEAFGDEAEFTDRFLIARESWGVRSFVREESMLHVVPLQDGAGHRFAYIYAVATDRRFRRQGLATALLHDAIAELECCFDAAILIPSGKEAEGLYRRAGFADSGTLAVFETEFDFGTGEPQNDRLMIMPFRETVLPPELHLHHLPKRQHDAGCHDAAPALTTENNV